MPSKIEYNKKKEELVQINVLGVNEVLGEIMNIYSLAENLVDEIKTMEPLQKIQNFKKVEKMLYKIDANLADVLRLYSLNLGDVKNTRLKKVFIDSLVFSLSREINKSFILLNS